MSADMMEFFKLYQVFLKDIGNDILFSTYKDVYKV